VLLLRALPVLFGLLLAARALAPQPAMASGFSQTWSVAGWTYLSEIGSTDSDPQPELMFGSNNDNHVAIFDGLTGAIEQEFPQFTSDNGDFRQLDIDGDGRPELFFMRPTTPLFTAYRWNGSSYVPLFSHTDAIQSWNFAHVRGSVAFDIVEAGSDDVRVRDLSGAVLFRASTAIAGWSGGSPLWASPTDLNHDGGSEILINDVDKTRLVKYSGSFAQSWVASGWMLASDAGSLDGDPQSELIASSTADGGWALLDGLTGAIDKQFPGYTLYNSSCQARLLDAGSPSYLFISIQPGLGSPSFTAYHWNGASIATLFSHTEQVDQWDAGHFRNTGQFEIVEHQTSNGPGNDVRIRDLAGNVLFRASTGIPGWSGQYPNFTQSTDLNHDGVLELLINDYDRVRLAKYTGAFAQSWVAGGWRIGEVLGNTDGDAHDEMLLASIADDHYGLFDGLTGAIEKDLPSFAQFTSGYFTADVGGLGRFALFMYHYLIPGQSPLFTAYRWNGSLYATMFTHTDSLQGADIRTLRSPGQHEVLEAGPSDVRLRDLSGAVIFRASTDIPGWAGLDPNSGTSIQSLDFDQDGIHELAIQDLARVHFVNHNGTTAVPAPIARPTFQLSLSTPNPFRTTTSFVISAPREGDAEIRIFDARGRLVRRLDQRLPAGPHAIRWDGRDETGRQAPSGVLFYEVTVEGARQARKMIRMR
jgi:FlgD Ig-like domain